MNNRCPTYDIIQLIEKSGGSIPIKSLEGKNLRINTHRHHRLRLTK